MSNLKAIITVGVSASGKSTFAKRLVENENYYEVNRDWIRFNIVHPGGDWSTYKFNKANENEVSKVHGQMIMEAYSNGQNIVVSDTNLSKGRRDKLVESLRDLGYTIEFQTFEITEKEAVKRDNLRANGVGAEVIYKQMLQMNEFKGRITYNSRPNKPAAIIVDVDGTIAQMNGRGPFEWHRVGEDDPRWFIIDMVVNYERQGYEIIIVSGRSDECKTETEEWLDLHMVPYSELHMRKSGDYRSDRCVKEEILWTHLAHKYNIVAAIDDRPMMIKLWYELKIPNVIAVANPYISF